MSVVYTAHIVGSTGRFLGVDAMDWSLFVIPASLGGGCLGLSAYLLSRCRRGRVDRALLVYLIALAAWLACYAVGMASARMAGAASTGAVPVVLCTQVALGGRVLLAAMMLNLVRLFLQRSARLAAAWWIGGLVLLAAAILLNPAWIAPEMTLLTVGTRRLGPVEFVRGASLVCWVGLMAAALLATLRVYQRTGSLMQRNRYRYVLLSLAVTIAGDLLATEMSYPLGTAGTTLKFVGALLLTLTILRYNLVDIRTLYRQALGHVAMALLMLAASAAAVWLALRIAGTQWFYAALIGIGIVSVLSAFAYTPLRNAIQRFVDRRLFHIEVDYSRSLHAYSERVLGMLELEPLAELAMNTLLFTTGARRGGLFLVREGTHEVGGVVIDPICRVGGLPEGEVELHPDSPLTRYLRGSDEPISQYEIELRDEFRGLPERERHWLRALAAELLLPVRNKERLIGLIALGPKSTRESYSPGENEWLKALADQTAVALENARLFDQVKGMSVNVMRLNADLQQAYDQLQQVDRLKSSFIGLISHELRSPFVAAGFSVELLRRYAERGMVDELQSQVEQLDRELAQGRKMLDGVISFASLLSKQGELHRQETEMGELVRAAVAPLESMARVRHIDLSCTLAPQLRPAQVDEARVSEAIYHLVHNAVKFNREEGAVRVSCWSTDSHFVFKVEDTGRGISAEQLAHIWEAFAQEADDVRRGVEGLGLGLALTKFVVDAHGGEVWAASRPGEGSTFGFRIPYQADAASS